MGSQTYRGPQGLFQCTAYSEGPCKDMGGPLVILHDSKSTGCNIKQVKDVRCLLAFTHEGLINKEYVN